MCTHGILAGLPIIFCVGEGDTFIDKKPQNLQLVLQKMQTSNTMHVVVGGGHSLTAGKVKKEEEEEKLRQAVGCFVGSVIES